MAADDNEVWGPGEMTRALKRIEGKVDHISETGVSSQVYERDRETTKTDLARIERRQDDHEADVDKRFADLTEKSRWTTGNWLAIGLAVFSGAVALYTAFGHGGG